jgi:prepilin-type processing-associated H-X9-DG protein
MAFAVVAFVLALLFPMTSTARSGGKSTVCLANLHLLGRAWMAFAEDNNGALCGGNTYNDQEWIGPPRTAGGVLITSNIPTSLADEARGFQAGQLWPYLNNAAVFHCPSDSKWELLGRGYRSVSIQGMMNGESWNHAIGTQPPTGYVTTISQIVSPSAKYVFIENVDPRGWNMGSWIMNWSATTPSLIDPIAVFHPGRTALGFADGHGEQHAWRSQRLIDWANSVTDGTPGGFNFSFVPGDGNAAEQNDVFFLANGYIPGIH